MKKVVLLLVLLMVLVVLGIVFLNVRPRNLKTRLPLDINVSRQLSKPETEKMFSKYGLVSVGGDDNYEEEYFLLAAHINAKETVSESGAQRIRDSIVQNLNSKIYSTKFSQMYLSDTSGTDVNMWRINVYFNKDIKEEPIKKELSALLDREGFTNKIDSIKFYDNPVRYIVRDTKGIGCSRLLLDKDIEDCGEIIPD